MLPFWIISTGFSFELTEPNLRYPAATASLSPQPVASLPAVVEQYLTAGYTQLNEENYPAAIESFQTALFLTSAQTAPAIIGEIQSALGHAHLYQGEYAAAVEHLQVALDTLEAIDNPDVEILEITAETFAGLGYAYLDVEEYEDALPLLEKAIAHFTSLADASNTPSHTEYLLNLAGSLGFIHQELSHFGSALTYYRQALNEDTLTQLLPETQADLLTNVGILETEIGQYTQAEATLKQAAALNRELGSAVEEATVIAALGWTYERQEKFAEAIASYQSASTLFQQQGETARAARAINNLGMLQLKQANTTDAEATLVQAQNLIATIENPEDANREKAILLDSFGSLHQTKGDFEQAWLTYRQALTLSEQNNDTIGQIDSLLNLGKLMESQDQPNLAIFFYKRAIAHIETIRQDLQQLSTAIQKRYTLTVEDFYRNLADLLLQQERTEEALQIIELLKLQEVTAYLHSSQENTTPTLLTPAEVTLENTFHTISTDLSLAEFTALPEVTALSQPPADSSAEASTEPHFQAATIDSIKAALETQTTKTAALYPLILKDRLEIVLITANGNPIHITQPVTASELSHTIASLQNKLKTDTLLPSAEAQQLYSWLIRPLEATLTDQEITNIIYLPDSILRYIPIATLHDGEQWFAEKYQSHNITAASIDDLGRTNTNEPNILAGAFTDAIPAHSVQIGQQQYAYPGLPAARQEIDNLLKLRPGTTAFFDHDFTPGNTLSAAKNNQIVHLATHANFIPGQPEASFVLFGDGSTVNMRDIAQWELPNVDLVVFSACQTALSVEGDGKEILGLGYQVQKTGAGAAIASLWSVDDTATAALMNQFYIALNQGKTKAEALRFAQRELIHS
ncbi:MAG: CHAT domain-containing protein, partial [Cyanobacteria bacterium P01_C01_bin.121]